MTADVDARLSEHLYGLMKFLLHGHGGDYVRAVGELELSLTQLRALHVLTYEAEQMSLKELADRLGLSLPAVSRSIDGLVQRGLVTRAEDAADRRMKQVRATAEAPGLLDRLTELRLAGIEQFLATLTPRERTKLASALALIAEREEIASRCTAPLTPKRRKDS
ncbi:MAG: MarR family winged helix-turn-helix transcriptional regulator [Thermoleophilaceae bacterium]